MDQISPNLIVLFVLIVPAALIGGIVWKPALALIICGALAILSGLTAIVTMHAFGYSIGVTAIVSGIAFIGFGRLIAFVEDIASETRASRREATKLAADAQWLRGRIEKAERANAGKGAETLLRTSPERPAQTGL